GRSEDDGRIERYRRTLARAARPDRPALAGECLTASISVPREGVELAALGHHDLRQQMRRRAEAVEADPGAAAGEPEGPGADETRAQQGRDVHVVEAGRKGEAEARVRHGLLRVPAVDRVPGESRGDAQVLATGEALRARLVGPPQPGNAHPLSDRDRA